MWKEVKPYIVSGKYWFYSNDKSQVSFSYGDELYVTHESEDQK